MIVDVVKVLLPAALAFFIGIATTPILTHYLYKYKAWKKTGGKKALDGSIAVEFGKLHGEKETKTPRMGGIVIWGSVALTTGALWLLHNFTDYQLGETLDFVSRSQTWIPLSTLLVGAVIGLINDILDVTGTSARGIRLGSRLLIITGLATWIGWWFYDKLDVTTISTPFGGYLEIGWLIIPLFVLTTLALYASGVIDGIDGLSGGVFMSVFGAYAGIAFMQHQTDLAAFCATVMGGILAFLWFNIPPARFWMTETGSMALTITIPAIAFLSDSLGEGKGFSVLPVVAFVLFATVASNVIQVGSKKLFKRKVFRIAPLHHHFEAIGWPSYKVTMRYWIISIVCALLGFILALVI